MTSTAPAQLLRKEFPLTIESVKEAPSGDGGVDVFDGLASVYDVIDLHGDVIVRGAFEDTLRRRGDERVLLYQHDIHRPIGTASFRDSEQALLTTGHANREVQDAREAMALVRQKAIKGLSIGFNITGEEWEGGIRHITGVDLWEVSVVTFPANPLANITEAKSAADALQELRAAHAVKAGAARLKAGEPLTAEQVRQLEAAMEILSSILSAPADEDEAEEPSDTLTAKGVEDMLAPLLTEIRSRKA